MIFILFGVILLLCIFIWDYFHKRLHNELFQKAGISGPKPYPVIGNVTEFIGSNSSNALPIVNGLLKKYGKVLRGFIFSESVLIITDAKYFESILSSQHATKKHYLYKLLTPWLGDGIILSSGAKWQSLRKMITASYHIKMLEQFFEIFDQQSCILVKNLAEKADGKTVVNIFPTVSLTALDIIAETAMGVKLNAQTNSNFPYVRAASEVSEITYTRLLNPVLHSEFLFKLFANKSYRHFMASLDIMHKITEDIIIEKRQRLETKSKDGTSKDAEENADVKKRMAFLDILLNCTVDGKPLSNRDLRDEVETMMFAGHETTASAMAYTLYLLARNPRVQQKLFEEISEQLGEDKKRSLTIKDLQELKYLDAVIKESLRLYSPIPVVGRVNEKNIEVDGHIIPPNVHMVLLVFAAGRDPDYFPQPDEFMPERFNSDSPNKIDPFASIPFLAGMRSCIGQKFASLEMKCVISKVIQHFELLPLGPDIQLVLHLSLRSSTGINLGLKPRVY